MHWMNEAVGLQTLLVVGDTTLAEREPGQLVAHAQLTLGTSKRQFKALICAQATHMCATT